MQNFETNNANPENDPSNQNDHSNDSNDSDHLDQTNRSNRSNHLDQNDSNDSSNHDDLSDDAVIGKAFRVSAIVLLAMFLVAGLAFFWMLRPPKKEAERLTELMIPENPQSSSVSIPKVIFREVTHEAGIDFVHQNGAIGEKLLPETMGGGVAFFDFDRDGDQDLLFVNSKDWKDSKHSENQKSTAALYENDGSGRFENVTKASGLDVSIYGMGVAIGDFDKDALPDVFITCVGENRLFRNLGGGRFEDVTNLAKVGGDEKDWSTCASWFDFDNDGDLDLFVGNYVKWNREIDFQLGTTLLGIGRAYGQPMNFEGTFPVLYRNEGGGVFTDVSEKSGIQITHSSTGMPVAKSLGIAPIDLNGDGWMDFILANDSVRNFVFSNRWDNTFGEIGALTGIAYDTYGKARGAMGIDTARYRADALAVGIANFAGEMTALYVEQGKPMIFNDEAIAAGIGPASRLLLKFGIFFFDYDLDGFQDLLTANGHLEEAISQVQKSQQYKQPAQIFWNSGPDHGYRFLEVKSKHAGEDLFVPIVGRGSAFADIDADGDLDFVLTQIGGAPRLFRNENALGNNWIRIRLIGKKQNRDGIGAWIKVQSDGRILWRQVMPTRSYLSQSELPITIGLGKNGKVDAVEILWQGGKRQSLSSVKRNQTTFISEE